MLLWRINVAGKNNMSICPQVSTRQTDGWMDIKLTGTSCDHTNAPKRIVVVFDGKIGSSFTENSIKSDFETPGFIREGVFR